MLCRTPHNGQQAFEPNAGRDERCCHRPKQQLGNSKATCPNISANPFSVKKNASWKLINLWSKKITPGMRFAPFLPPKKTHLSWDLPGKSPIFRPEALLCSSAMVSWFPPGVLPQVLVVFSQSKFYNFDSWKL